MEIKYIKILMMLTFGILLISCNSFTSENSKGDPKKSISYFIKKDTGLEIDTNFRILADSTHEIDCQDYTIYYTIEFNPTQNLKIIEQIENSRYFNQESITSKSAKFWNQLVKDSLKGYWYSFENGYRFVDIPLFEDCIDVKGKSYSVYTEVDTFKNILSYEFRKI